MPNGVRWYRGVLRFTVGLAIECCGKCVAVYRRTTYCHYPKRCGEQFFAS
eukprot:TRINITY_DN519_c0_g1_i2.p2 TRINITY_DN519_c0_g1~~TRINITY_DN519_c0_g1_i2.p2  ORF type:complete len:50 (-),score=0.50 TRINITY_DN519_c0_g1_i2:173-322(-)